MALNIKNPEVERLAAELASLTGESKTGAVGQALREKLDRIGRGSRRKGDLRRFLETEVWPLIPAEELDRPPMTKAERAEILGYGPEEH
jgi:antitoxin VapB